MEFAQARGLSELPLRWVTTHLMLGKGNLSGKSYTQIRNESIRPAASQADAAVQIYAFAIPRNILQVDLRPNTPLASKQLLYTKNETCQQGNSIGMKLAIFLAQIAEYV